MMLSSTNDPKTLFEIWAPPDSIWSPWAKPVTFMVRPRPDEGLFGEKAKNPDPDLEPDKRKNEEVLPDAFGLNANRLDTALIVNLRGVQSVMWGVALAERGFRPVPLFNAGHDSGAVLNVPAIADALHRGADILRNVRLANDSPPAFLLDSERFTSARRPTPGMFDNRWIVFPQDMPSRNFMAARGIKSVILIQDSPRVDRDLARILALWRRVGIEIKTYPPPRDQAAQFSPLETPLDIKPLPRFSLSRTLFLASLAGALGLGLRRNAAGGFGGRVPTPSSGYS